MKRANDVKSDLNVKLTVTSDTNLEKLKTRINRLNGVIDAEIDN